MCRTLAIFVSIFISSLDDSALHPISRSMCLLKQTANNITPSTDDVIVDAGLRLVEVLEQLKLSAYVSTLLSGDKPHPSRRRVLRHV